MYLRTTQRRNRDGSSVRYLQLAHNHWDPKAGRSSVQVLYHFGREDQLRPVYHRKQERIQAHVLLCWLGLLLIRMAENGTGQAWHRLRWELDKMHLGASAGAPGWSSSGLRRPQPSAPSSARSTSTNRPASSTSSQPTQPRPPELRPSPPTAP